MLKGRLLALLICAWTVLSTGCGFAPAGQGAPSPLAGAGPAIGALGSGTAALGGSVNGTLPTGGTAAGAGVDPGAVSGTRGTAAENIAGLDASGLLARGSQSNDGRLTFTQYGGPTDRTPDGNTAAGIGNRGNRLRATSLALSPNLIRAYGLKGGEEIYIKTGGRSVFLGTYDDTTGSSARNNVIDVYDPQDRLGRDNFMRTIAAGNWELSVGRPSA